MLMDICRVRGASAAGIVDKSFRAWLSSQLTYPGITALGAVEAENRR